jgi:hypothetical protein
MYVVVDITHNITAKSTKKHRFPIADHILVDIVSE